MPSRPPIPHSKPTLGEDEAQAAAQVVRSGYIAEGPKTAALETELANLLGVKHAVAVNTGSSALHLALLALGVGEGDEVILPSYVCTALLNAVHYVRATPVLADVDASLNLDPADCKRKRTRRTAAIIAPHLLGNPAAIDDLLALGPPVIEDCAQAIGATLPDAAPAGSRGTLAVFSFYATKMLAAGECGAVAGDSAKLLDKVRDLKDYDERPRYTVRYNYKCNDLAAAIACCQLRRLPEFVARRREIAMLYAKTLGDACELLPAAEAIPRASCFRFVLLTKGRAKSIIDQLQTQGVIARRPVFKPLHRYLGQAGFPATDRAWRSAVSLPIYPSLSRAESQRVARAALRVLT